MKFKNYFLGLALLPSLAFAQNLSNLTSVGDWEFDNSFSLGQESQEESGFNSNVTTRISYFHYNIDGYRVGQRRW